MVTVRTSVVRSGGMDTLRCWSVTLCLLAAVASCSKKPTTTTAEPSGEAAPTDDGPPANVHGPADEAPVAAADVRVDVVPGAEIDDVYSWTITTDQLPAINSDGTLIAIGYRPPDGDRGFPGLKVFVHRVDGGARVETFEVLDPDAFYQDGMTEVTPGFIAALAKRVATVNKYLAAAQWRTMKQLEDPDIGNRYTDSPTRTARLGAIEVSYTSPRLTIKRDGKILIDKEEPGWQIPDSPRDECTWEDSLSGVFIDPESNALLVQINYWEGHHCGSEDDQLAIFRLP